MDSFERLKIENKYRGYYKISKLSNGQTIAGLDFG